MPEMNRAQQRLVGQDLMRKARIRHYREFDERSILRALLRIILPVKTWWPGGGIEMRLRDILVDGLNLDMGVYDLCKTGFELCHVTNI